MTGRATIPVAGDLRLLRADVDRAIRSGNTSEALIAAVYVPGGADPTAGGAIRTVRVAGGLLAVASWTGAERVQAVPNASISWQDKTTGKLLGQVGQQDFLVRRLGMTALISIPDQGTPTVFGSEWGTLLNGS